MRGRREWLLVERGEREEGVVGSGGRKEGVFGSRLLCNFVIALCNFEDPENMC